MLVATGAVFTIVNANKKAHSLKSVASNLNFALESMVKDIRVGDTYTCVNNPSTCGTSGDTAIQFTSNRDRDVNGSNDIINYTFDSVGNSIKRQVNCSDSSAGCDVSGPVQVTSSDTFIRSMKFYVLGNLSNDNEQPRILITISGYVTSTGIRSDFNIQTLVTQRVEDQ
jgi:hypothetical protein